jgi:hypothetical protein
VVTSEVILHFENRWESNSANQDSMVDTEEFLKPGFSRNSCFWENCDIKHCAELTPLVDVQVSCVNGFLQVLLKSYPISSCIYR